MPTRKKKGEAKKAGTETKGGTRPSRGTRPVKLERDLTSSDYPTSSEERLEVEGEIFFDATNELTIVRDCATALAPSVDITASKGHKSRSRVTEIGQAPQKRTPYFPKYFSRPTRYSVGVQTVPLEKNGGGIKNPSVETLRWGGIDPEEMEMLHRENSSEEEYEDARENLAEDPLLRQEERGRERMRSKVKSRDRRDQMVQVSCPRETCQETTDLGSRTTGNRLEKHPRQAGGPDHSVEEGYQDSQEPSCCSCLLTVLYWLALMLLISFLLSLFLTVFLLFSCNHGLGIGPGLLYSDVGHIRNQVDPYLDLRHKGPPPT